MLAFPVLAAASDQRLSLVERRAQVQLEERCQQLRHISGVVRFSASNSSIRGLVSARTCFSSLYHQRFRGFITREVQSVRKVLVSARATAASDQVLSVREGLVLVSVRGFRFSQCERVQSVREPLQHQTSSYTHTHTHTPYNTHTHKWMWLETKKKSVLRYS